MKISKKKIFSLVAAILALTLVAGTWAYFNQTADIDNELQTLAYGSRIIEDFPADQSFEPGHFITKGVGVINTGSYPILTRIKFDEKWEREGTGGDMVAFKEIAYNTESNTPTAEPKDGKFAITSAKFIEGSGTVVDSWTSRQGDPETLTDPVNAWNDGEVENDNTEESVVFKDISLVNALTDAGWVYGNDGYFYYTKILEAGAATAHNLLNGIRLASDADIGAYNGSQWYSVADKAAIAQTKEDILQAIADGDLDPMTAAEIENVMNGATVEIDGVDYGVGYNWIAENEYDSTDDGPFTFRKADKDLDSVNGGYSNALYTLTVTTEVLQATEEAVEADWPTAVGAFPDLFNGANGWFPAPPTPPPGP